MRFIVELIVTFAVGFVVVSRLSGAAMAIGAVAIALACGVYLGITGLRDERRGARSDESTGELREDR